ncbi:MAG: SMC-Scp complex subunit ScpB [Deltaproteobacteria bacterium]|nr:SMC-Scp complex subunit ScpB [Deltaproteobacteria bacterium]
MSDKDSLKPLIESLIFASEGALSLDRLSSVLEGEERAVVKEAVEDLIEEYKSSGRGILIEEVAGGYQFRTNPDSSPWLRKFFKIGMQKISKAAMESLAIIAYKQPATRGELEAIRGVDSGGVLATLMEKRFIKITGRKEVPGRPVVYGTTREFLETFDLKDLSCLPSLKDIQKMEEEHAAETQGYEGAAESTVQDPVQDETSDNSVVKDDIQERSPAEGRTEEEELDEGGGENPRVEDPDREGSPDEGRGETVEEGEDNDPFEGGFDEEPPGRGGRGKTSEDNSHGGDNVEEEGGGADTPGEGDGKPGDGN